MGKRRTELTKMGPEFIDLNLNKTEANFFDSLVRKAQNSKSLLDIKNTKDVVNITTN